MKTLMLEVAGMTCGHCGDSVAHILTAVPGVQSARADLLSGHVRVEIDEARCGPPQLVEAVRAAGFTVSGFRAVEP